MSTRPNRPPRDAAAEITALIIARIEAGTPPWKRPWTLGNGDRPLRHCGTPYTGINALYLWAVADGAGYTSRFWMTYRQALALGGQVRKDERGAISVYYSSFQKGVEATAIDASERRTIRFLRAYSVFNASQIDHLPAHFYPSDAALPPIDPSSRQAEIDRFFAAIPANVREGGDRAYYDPIGDHIQLPPRAAFASADLQASTKAHEHVHWSGHPNRLARRFGKRFGDDGYAREELVAELGSGLICADLGLPSELHDSHASYVAHWLRILRSDKTAIIKAASKAEQAYRYLKSFGAPLVNAEIMQEQELADVV